MECVIKFALCPCLCSTGEVEEDYDVIPEKGEYYGDTDFKGAKHGHGMFLYGNGDMYEGEWKKDKKHGFGEYRFRDGNILNGYFENDKFVGKPPPGVQPKQYSSKHGTQPLLQQDLRSDVKPMKVKHNEMGYSFAKTMGDLKQSVAKRTKKQANEDSTDFRPEQRTAERQPLIAPPRNTREYEAVQGRADPRISTQIAIDKQRKEQERRERVERIKKKYNIKPTGPVRT